MKLCVLALDYDGTVAMNDTMDPGIRAAIANARSRNITVILATGRRLADLRRAAGDLHFVDAVVAENGAVLHLPGSGYSTTLAPPPSQALLKDLTTRGVPHIAGECLVEAAAEHAHSVLEAIRARELPLSILFNRGRLMVLPQAISKATGLCEILTIYSHAVLPALARLRRRTGLPHRVVVDEAHYSLNGAPANRLLDLQGNGYTLVTCRASHLPKAVLDASEVILVTCESDPAEVAALHALCRSTEPIERWRAVLGGLALGEAAALPITEEAGASPRRIHLGLRITHHVRHREKYVDVPVPETRAFVFTNRNASNGTRATTLKDFAVALDINPADALEGHARRGDFSRWLRDVFGDYPLALEVQALEERCRTERDTAAVAALASAIRGRYDLTANDDILCEGAGK
jgi:hypothetical protein